MAATRERGTREDRPVIKAHSFVALMAGLSVGFLLAINPQDSSAASLVLGPGATVSAAPHLLLSVAEKTSSKASQQRSTTTKKVITTTPKKTTTTTKQKQPTSNTGSAKTGTTGGTKTTGSGSIGGGTKTTGTASKTKTPMPGPGDVATKERSTGTTIGNSLDDILSGKTPRKDAENTAGKDEAPVLNAPAEGEGTTYTSQQVTQEELEQFAEEHPDQLSDSDGDGVYEAAFPLDEDAQVMVEDGKAYIDEDGDGDYEYVVSAENYDAESGAITLPVSADNYVIVDADGSNGEPYGKLESPANGGGGIILADLDGDGVNEVYSGYDTDGDGVADFVSAQPYDLEHAPDGDQILAAIESGALPTYDYPDFSQDTAQEGGPGVDAENGPGVDEENSTGVDEQVGQDSSEKNGEEMDQASDEGGEQTQRVRVGLNIAPPAAATAPATNGAMDSSDLVASLEQLKMLREQGVLSVAEHESAQLRALADVNAERTGIEGGLGLLRQLWESELITEAPYAQKRQELLDAL